MSANQIRLDYLNREEPELTGEYTRPALKVQDKCYRVHIHEEKITRHNEALWNDAKEAELVQFAAENGLDTKCALEIKNWMLKGLNLVEAYERYLDTRRKPHPRYFITARNKSDNEAVKMWKRVGQKTLAIKGTKIPTKEHYLDDPNPENWYDLEVKY